MKKSELKTIVREIVREEVAKSIHEVISELKQPTVKKKTITKKQPKKKMVEKKQYTSNSVLNEVLNETANSEWETMGDGIYDSSNMNEIISKQYGDITQGNGQVNADAMIASMGENPKNVSQELKDNMFNKDYRSLMKAIDKKQRKV
jgi:hypothetical protein|tara:strand:- start:193 stop:633 length:441 start_codon:yes stop_codon:yes gene_type:complete